jgi:hypothetical protein
MLRARPWWAWAFPAVLVFIVGISLVADLSLLGFDGAWFAGHDKALHFVLYGACGLFAVAWFHRRRAIVIIAVVAALVLLEELSQGLFPHRSLDLLDALASIAGVVTGGALAHRLRARGGTRPDPVSPAARPGSASRPSARRSRPRAGRSRPAPSPR